MASVSRATAKATISNGTENDPRRKRQVEDTKRAPQPYNVTSFSNGTVIMDIEGGLSKLITV